MLAANHCPSRIGEQMTTKYNARIKRTRRKGKLDRKKAKVREAIAKSLSGKS
jgi:hypothetical protein